MEITDGIDNPLEIVNRFIESSFGKGWKGNYLITKDRTFSETEHLNFIGKISWRYALAGKIGMHFMIADGSIIAVFPEYKEKAIDYCILYEDFFKKETKLIITDREHIGTNQDNFFGFKKYSPSEQENELTKGSNIKQRLLQERARSIEEAVKSLILTEEGILTSNGYQNEEEKKREYLELAKSLSFETRSTLIGKLGEELSFFKLSEEKNPQSIKKYFERFGAPIETISDLELFYTSLLKIK
jgi:hypothetical protein